MIKNVGIGKRIKNSPQQIALVQPGRFEAVGRLILSASKPFIELSLLAMRHPMVSSVVLVALVIWGQLGWQFASLFVALLAGGLVVWRWRAPASFRVWVGVPALSSWRREWRYRRHWQPAMMLSGLGQRYRGDDYLPRLRRVTSDRFVDRVRMSLTHGQTPGDVEKVADRLAETFKVEGCKVVWERPGEVTLVFTRGDVLAGLVPAVPIPESPDLMALTIGHRENYTPERRWDALVHLVKLLTGRGELRRSDTRDVSPGLPGRSWWRLRLLGTHILIAGATGAGKSSVLWSILRSLDAAIRAGYVQVFAIDPKGGMELAFGASMFADFVYGDDQENDPKKRVAYEIRFAEFLEERVAEMRRRQARARGVTRLILPSLVEPLQVVMVDELASLTEYVLDRDAKKRIAAALSLLLSQGRAVSVLVVGAVQDPRKETVPFRDLFPTRIALRMTEAEQVDLVLGKGSHDRGAHCELIPHSTPGVGYVVLEGIREPVRVRAGHVTDTDIHTQAQRHTAPKGRTLRTVDIPTDRAA